MFIANKLLNAVLSGVLLIYIPFGLIIESEKQSVNEEKSAAMKTESILTFVDPQNTQCNATSEPEILPTQEVELLSVCQETPQPTVTVSPTSTVTKVDHKCSSGYVEGETYTMRVYHYCSCRRCTPGTGVTASGKVARNGMVAMYGLPFGSIIEINGKEYTVEDRGVGRMKVDIFCEEGHKYCLNRGTYSAEVKIVYINN